MVAFRSSIAEVEIVVRNDISGAAALIMYHALWILDDIPPINDAFIEAIQKDQTDDLTKKYVGKVFSCLR
jgi:hypothetical protein